MKPEDLDIPKAYNSAILAANFVKALESLDVNNEEQIQNIALLIEKLSAHIQSTPECDELSYWRIGLLGLRILKTEHNYQTKVDIESGDLLDERERLSALQIKLKKEVSKLSRKANEINLEKALIGFDTEDDIEKLILLLKTLPLPAIYFGKAKDARKQNHKKETEEEDKSPLIRLIAYIDNVPLLAPQILRPRLLYSLKFIVRGVSWPDNAIKLHLDLPTTLPKDEYSVSKFELSMPNNNSDEFEGELNGQIRFSSSQTIFSQNISFILRCAFELQNGQFDEIPVIGYNQLEFRISDSKNSGITSGYQRLDQHLVQLLTNLISEIPNIKDELDDLLPLLQELTNLVGVYAQSAVFKDFQNILEAEFQSKVLNDLRLKLGEDIQEHPSQAGGHTDIKFRGTVIELKVEHQESDRKSIGERYSAQAAQYQSVEGKQISIVLVLDLTPKINPPSDIRNDIFLVDVVTHGGDDSNKPYPSKAFIFVVNGNMKKPSEYSRKRKR
jgi:hypothetical protein